MTASPRKPPASLRLVDNTVPAPVAPNGATPLKLDDRDIDWSILMARAQAGDGGAYRRLLTEVMPFLRALAARQHREPSDQEDAVQDILLTIHTVRRTYDPSRPFGPWLVAIAKRRLVDRLRRQGRQRLRESPLTGLHDGIAGEPTNHPEASDHRALHAALRALTPGQQRAVRLLRLEEMSLKEAETASGTSIASLKVTLHRALKSLRKILSDRSQT